MPPYGSLPLFYLYDSFLSYDSTDGYVVLFGDPVSPAAAAPAQTWIYRQANWTELPTRTAPSACLSSAFANDPAGHDVIYFAGTTSANGSACPAAGQTWSYHAGNWTRLSPTTSPSARFGASLTNDSSDGYLLLFGGVGSACAGTGGVCGDTWNFSAGNWTELAPSTSPVNRSSAGMTYDARDGYVLLFGGEGSGGGTYSMLNDTWSFHAGNWTQLHPKSSPPQPAPDGLAYDYADGYALYTQVCGNLTNDIRSEVTWNFSGGAWSALSGSCSYSRSSGAPPPQRLGEGLTYDGATGQVVFCGGGGIYFAPRLTDTWTYRAGSWTNVTPNVTAVPFATTWSGFAYDTADDAFVLFAGEQGGNYVSNTTWERTAGNWTELSPTRAPSPRWGPLMTYDAADGYVLLLGGVNATGHELNDTWEFVGGGWTLLTPTTAPGPTSSDGAGLVYDGADGYVVYYGGEQTWTYRAGVWTNITSTSGVPLSAQWISQPLAYDATDGYVLLFGTEHESPSNTVVWSNTTWSFSGGTWTNRTATAGRAPPPRYYATMAGVGPTGGVVLFGGFCALTCPSGDSEFADTWIYINGTWHLWRGSEGPSQRWGAPFAFDDVLGFGLLVGGYNSSDLRDEWEWNPSPSGAPFIDSFAASPSTVDIGGETNLTAIVGGGVGYVRFDYTGLPAGCVSSNVSFLPCAPSNGSAGTYSITLTITDADGNVSVANTTVVVHDRPTITGFSASPGSVSVGQRTLLAVAVSGGSSPFTFVYSGLPPGCPPQTVPTLPCVPDGSGTFTPMVNVTDAYGELATATIASLNVTPLVAGSLTLSGFAASPSALLVGNASYLNVTARTSTGSLTFSYSSLPLGCASSNVSSLLCQPSDAGSFDPVVNVSDGLGDHLALATRLAVYPTGAGGSLTVTEFGASPARVTLGETTVLYIEVARAASDVSYAYTGLPPGCLSENRSVLPCTPTSPGEYLVGLFANVSGGLWADAHQPLIVAPEGTPATPASIVSFTLAPSMVTVGSLVRGSLTVRAAPNGTSYSYLGLPAGCVSENSTSWSCQPQQPGGYAITAIVHSPGYGATLRAIANLTVTPDVPTAPHASTPTSVPGNVVIVWVAAAAVAAGAVGVLVYLLIRRRGPT